MTNLEFKQNDLASITVDLIAQVMQQSLNAGHNSFAALGCNGDDFLLYGESRRREISLRLHSGDVKLLVTDNCGSFLFHGGFDNLLLPISFIAKQYFEIIENVKHLLDNTDPKSNLSESDKEEMIKRQCSLHPFLHGTF
jgi:hypothetical protein